MQVSLVAIGLSVGLMIAAIITKRRFGVLSMALATGQVLTLTLSAQIDSLVKYLGLYSFGSLVSIIFSLLPGFVLMAHGYKYKRHHERLIGSILFFILTLGFISSYIGQNSGLPGVLQSVYAAIYNYHNLIIGGGLILAIVDMLFAKVTVIEKAGHKH